MITLVSVLFHRRDNHEEQSFSNLGFQSSIFVRSHMTRNSFWQKIKKGSNLSTAGFKELFFRVNHKNELYFSIISFQNEVNRVYVLFPLAGQACYNINKCNKTPAFPILKQYYTKFSFIFIIYSNKKSLSVLLWSFKRMH